MVTGSSPCSRQTLTLPRYASLAAFVNLLTGSGYLLYKVTLNRLLWLHEDFADQFRADGWQFPIDDVACYLQQPFGMQNPNPCVAEHLLPEQSWMNLTREWLRLDTAAAWRAMWRRAYKSAWGDSTGRSSPPYRAIGRHSNG